MTTLSPRFKDIAIRALKTAVQAFIATVAASTAAGVSLDASAWRAIVIAAGSAAVSAAWNSVTSSLTATTDTPPSA
jgi:hypothetical protein